MRFIFDKLSIFVVVFLLTAFAIFGFFMTMEGKNTGYDETAAEQEDAVQINKTEKNLFRIPGATIPEASVNSDFLGDFTFWENTTVWDEFSLTVPWFEFDFSLSSIFPNLFNGYEVMADELNGAPVIFQNILILSVSVAVVLIVAKSFEVSV